jgi:glycosyltransferase involved in cell wall biosynthesis
MRVVIDGVIFQLAGTGLASTVARVWSSLLPHLSKYDDLELVLLDRGNAPGLMGIEKVAFPSYKMNTGTAADSFLIEKFCKELGGDVFISTYYTTPVTVPSVLVVHDMIPEILGFDLNIRPWQEKQIAINFAVNYACVSRSTKLDLERFYPGTSDRAIVTYCGVDRDLFRPKDRSDFEHFKAAIGISSPYYLLVGARQQHGNYKNGILAFKAARRLRDAEIELICVGGEPQLASEFIAELPCNVSARRLDLTDTQLACAYSGAEALIFPSRYEGFGMPIVEAMACGCPVITTTNGSLAEVAGDAAFLVAWDDADGLACAMSAIRQPAVRRTYIERGRNRAAGYDWELMAKGVQELLLTAHEQGSCPRKKEFFHEWERLRRFQAAVDPC